MDVGAVLAEVLERRGWTLSELAARAGSSRGNLWRYANGAASPSVRTLDRILAAADLQLRADLEPLLAPVDARVDAMLEGTPHVDVAEIGRLVAAVREEQNWAYEDPDTREVGRRSGRIAWALDGATALNVHGLACPMDALSLVLLLDDAARSWLTRGMVRGTAPGDPVGWWSATFDEARAAFAALAVGRYGILRIRPVTEMPPVLDVQLEGLDECVPVVSVDEVEASRADLAEVLARLRARRRT